MSALATAAGMIETVKTVSDIVKNITTDRSNDYANSQTLKSAVINGNFIKLVRSGIIEPTILVTENALYQDDLIDKINNLIVDNFMAFYTQVFTKITSTGIVTPVEAIDIMSTNLNTLQNMKDRTKDFLLKHGKEYIKDKYEDLVTKEQLRLNNLNLDLTSLYLNDDEIRSIKKLATERINDLDAETTIAAKLDQLRQPRNYPGQDQRVVLHAEDAMKNIFGTDNYLYKVLTRQFELCLSIPTYKNKLDSNGEVEKDKYGLPVKEIDSHKSLVIPMIIRANIKFVNINEIAAVCSSKDKSKSFMARYHEWKSGGISLLELIFCSNLIKQDKMDKLNKDSSLLKDIEQANFASEIRKKLTGFKGFETMYSSLVITAEEIDYLSKINNTDYEGKAKNQLLSMLNGFMLVVIDTNTVRIHIKEINGVVTVNHKSLKRRGDSDNNVLDFFKSLTTGNSIRF